MVAMKLMPQIISWVGIVLILLRGLPGRRPVVMTMSISGLVIGAAGTFILFRSFPATVPIGVNKSVLGASFLLFWFFSIVPFYRSTARDVTISWVERLINTPVCAVVGAFLAGIMAGGVCICRTSGPGENIAALLLLVIVAGILAFLALSVEQMLPDSLIVSPSGLLAAVVALLLFSASSILRLDLFSPLSMKVMKFAHDFVHQFMESMLIPDHVFIRPAAWKYIGFLFGKEVGFWGGLFIWFTPPLLVLLAVQFEQLPQVANIRQGAQRRKLLATALRERRLRLIIPLLAMVVFAAAAYQSRFPNVEYWDPKPIEISATASGEIIIPKKGDVDLGDGKLHKFLFKQGGKEARFFVLFGPSGQFTVDLDACAICKPDGYGQAEGAVFCYYCVTLIPLETVGKPGGCNPVPVPFTEKEVDVRIDALTLINLWSSTVQATARVKEAGK
jgi:hypothetical protein